MVMVEKKMLFFLLLFLNIYNVLFVYNKCLWLFLIFKQQTQQTR